MGVDITTIRIDLRVELSILVASRNRAPKESELGENGKGNAGGDLELRSLLKGVLAKGAEEPDLLEVGLPLREAAAARQLSHSLFCFTTVPVVCQFNDRCHGKEHVRREDYLANWLVGEVGFPRFDVGEEGLAVGTTLEEADVLLVVAEVGDFGEKVEVAGVLTGKEEEEGVDGVAI